MACLVRSEKNGVYRSLTKYFAHAQRVLFITGAGLSADSGLPTYRGIGGLYNDRYTEDEIPIEVALSGEMFLQSPEITWKYLLEIEFGCRQAGHNIAHRIIAEFEKLIPDTWVLTQNIDGFHRTAGSKNLIEMHGSFSQLYCLSCGVWETVNNYSHLDLPATCEHCGGLVRPSVVLFGEPLPVHATGLLERELGKGFDVIFSVGTSSVFPYIAQPILQARSLGAVSVEINPGETGVSREVDYKMFAGAADAMRMIWDALGQSPPKNV